MDKPIIKTVDERASEIATLFFQGIECWQKAGELVVDLIDEDSSAVEIIKERSGGVINGHMIAIFERIGRKQLVPRLAYMSGPGPERLKKMPFSLQQQYLTEPVTLLVLRDDERIDKLQVAVTDLTALQAAQVFDRDTIRSLPAQRAWLEDERAKLVALAKPIAKMPYRISGKRVTFLEGCTLTARELSRILSEIDR